MKILIFINKGWMALLLPLLFAGNGFAQVVDPSYIVDIPQSEEACYILSGEQKNKYLALSPAPTEQKVVKGKKLKGGKQVTQGLYLTKEGESKWAFRPVKEEDNDGEYFLECVDGSGRVIVWSDVEGLFFYPLSRMDGKMREMATWTVRLAGINDIGESYYIIRPIKEKGKVLAVGRKTDKVDVFADPSKLSAGRDNKKMAKEAKRDAPGLEVLWKRLCKK